MHRFNILNGQTCANYGVYETSDGKFLAVGALEPKFWSGLCEVIGKGPAWGGMTQAQLMVEPPPGREPFPLGELEEIFRSRTRDEWVRAFEGADCCVTPVMDLDEIGDDEYHIHKGSIVPIEDSSAGFLKGIAMKAAGTNVGFGLPFSLVEKS